MNSEKQSIEQRVAAHPFFRGMEAHQLAILSQSAMPTEFSAGQWIFRAGDPANGFYLIEVGLFLLAHAGAEASRWDGPGFSSHIVGSSKLERPNLPPRSAFRPFFCVSIEIEI